nr:trypsin-like peptidase domain-containing protein [Auraticoccus cholistanensis]
MGAVPPGPVPGWGPRPAAGPGAHGRPDDWAAPLSAPTGAPATGPGPGPSPHTPGPDTSAPPFFTRPPGEQRPAPAAAPAWQGAPPAGPWGRPAPAPRRAEEAPAGRRRGVVAVAALTALLVGGAAGVGGAVVGEQLLAGPAPSTAPQAPRPQPSQPAPSPGQVPSSRPTQPAVGVAAAVLPSTVTIESSSSTGSGFVIGDDGTIMTNNHVVAEAAGAGGSGQVKVIFDDGTRVQATIVGRSPSYDLAVIRVQEGPVVPVQIGSSEDAAIGQPAVAVGSPLGLGGTVTEGIISALDRPVVVGGGADAQGASAYINAIQTDAPINPGNSGGPLVDAEGRVIGVNSAILSLGDDGRSQGGNIGVGFAIPIDQAMQIGQLLIEDGQASYPVIGANVRTQPDDSGVLLSDVNPGGPAERAGLRAGDVVQAIDGRRVWETVELIVAIRTHRPGDTVTLTVLRDGRTQDVAVELDGQVG